MDDWRGLRIALIILAWATVAGGATLASLWSLRGGLRARGPEEDETPAAGAVAWTDARVTSFTTAQVGVHGLLGVLTASLLTYAVLQDDRRTGYLASLVALALTAVPGVLMFVKWRRRGRPERAAAGRTATERVEDRLPGPIVYLHGLAALTTAAIVAILLVVD